MTKWVRVTERLPLNGQQVLFCDHDEIYYGRFRIFGSEDYEWLATKLDGELIKRVTDVIHWTLPIGRAYDKYLHFLETDSSV